MKRTKYPLTDVQTLNRPDLIWNYDPKTGKGPLHIADKVCKHGADRKSLTRCGRPMYPDHHAWEMREELSTFRLCERCGTAVDFTYALAEFRAWDERRRVEDDERRAKEQVEREAAWADKVRRVNILAAVLVAAGLRVGVTNGTATIEHDGFEFQLNAKGPITK